MYGFFRASRFAAAFTLFAHIASPSIAAETQAVAAAPVAAPVTAAAIPAGVQPGIPAAVPAPAPAVPVSAPAVPVSAPTAPVPAPTAPAPAPTTPTAAGAGSQGAAGQVRQVWVFNPSAAQTQQPYASPGARPSLQQLVGSFVNQRNQDAQQLCLAKAVYFEARGESLEGQLAVAEVVLNRASSGRYPATICEVVTQPWQFSFIRRGRFPRVDENCLAWHRALAVADIAKKGLADSVASNVLWYHATYVSPSWGRRLTRVAKIGAHIFYS